MDNDLRIIGYANYILLQIKFYSKVSAEQAQSAFIQSADAFSRVGSNANLVLLYLFWAKYCRQYGQLRDAIASFESANQLFNKLPENEQLTELKNMLHTVKQYIEVPRSVAGI